MRFRSVLSSLRCAATAALILFAVPAVNAQSYYWGGGSANIPGTGTGISLGGVGNWNTTAANWDTGAGNPYGPWDNSLNLTAVFGGTAAGTVTLDVPITVGGMQFNTTGYTLAAGTNGLSFGAANNTVLFNNVAAAIISGTVGGTGNLLLTSTNPATAGTMTFNGASAGGWSGTTTINAGMTLVSTSNTPANSQNLVLKNTAGITLNGGSITVNRHWIGPASEDYINNSAPITVNSGGTLNISSATAGNTLLDETIHSVTVNSGQFNLSPGNGSSGSRVTVANGITRIGTASIGYFTNSVANFSTNNTVTVTGAGTTLGWVNAAASNPIIGPHTTLGTAAALQTDYAVYSADRITPANTVASAESNWTGATSQYTVNAGLAGVTLTGTRNVSALRWISANNTGTATSGNANFTLTGHGYVVGDAVVISSANPTGFNAGQTYFVVAAGVNTFQLSATSGGSVITPTSGTSPTITAAVLLSTGNNLGTTGLLAGSTTTLNISATGTGAVTLPSTTSENLFATTGSGTIRINAPITDNGAGVLTLVKTGSAGSLILNGTNTYSGGTVLNSGTVTITADANLGAADAGITFNGNAILNWNTATTLSLSNRTITINEGAVAQFTSGNSAKTYPGVLQGTGTLYINATTSFIFSNTANTFTGPITVTTGNSLTFGLEMASLPDTAGLINLNNGSFRWTKASGGATTFANRQFALAGATTGGTISNLGATTAETLTITKDLLVTGVGNKTITLAGSNTGDNVFSGNIRSVPGSVISVIKSDAGRWSITSNLTNIGGLTVNGAGTLNLSGTNSYSGTTTIGSGNPNSVLNIQGLQALSPNTTLNLVSLSTPAGTLRLLDDTGGVTSTVNLPNTLTQDSANATINFIVFVGNNNTANGGTSSGTTTGSTISLNRITASALSNTKLIYGFRSEGANGYILGINNVEIPAFPAATFTSATTWKWQLTANSAPISITGTVQQLAGSTSATLLTQTLELTGTNSGNVISGNILNSLDATARPLAVTKLGASAWTLSGDNTFSGGLSLNGATAGSRLNINSATALGTGTFTVSGGDNASIDNTSGGAIVNANNNAMTWNNNFTFAGSNDLNIGNGNVTMGGNRTVTVNGTGVLTVGGVVSGAFGLSIGGTGMMILTGASTFTGQAGIGTNVAGLRVRVNALADLGVPSPLGSQATAANGVIRIGNTSNPATLEFVNLTANQSTNRQVQIGTSTSGSGGAVIVNDDPSFTVTFSNPAFNVAATGTSTFNRGLTLGGSNTGNNTIAGAIINNVGTSGGLVSLTKTGTGTWVLQAANTYTNGTTVTAGTLSMSTNGTPGATTGALTVNNPNTGPGTNVVLNLATAIDTTTGRLSGTIAVPSSGVNTATINTGGSGLNFTVNQTAAATYAGVIAGDGTLTLGSLSTNTLTLTGANSHTGGTVVTAGTLAADTAGPTNSATGTAAVTVTGGTLRGTGNIAGAITLNGGTIAPGDATNAGVLTTAQVPLLILGNMNFNVSGGAVNSSQLNITGAGTLGLGAGITLTVTPFTGVTDPAYFTLISSLGGTVTGTFVGLPEGSTVFTNTGTGTNYVINYGTFAGEPGNVVLSASAPVPEPTAGLAVLFGLAACAQRRRR